MRAVGLFEHGGPEVLQTAKGVGAKITYGGPLSIEAIKEMTYGSLEGPYGQFSAEKTVRFQATSSSADAQEGVDSFMQKRPPIWQGR